MTDLFTPMDLHGLALPNRIWMSAMTRNARDQGQCANAADG
jgi:2,4-dienoyl-CoA reductase-like NADH-dependent reductase (Old Yellow Enzyme family)